MFISQTKYTNDMLKKFDMDKAKPIKTPIPTESASSLLVGFGLLNDNVIKGLTRLLSVNR